MICLTKFGLEICIGSRKIIDRVRKASGYHSTFLDINTSSKHPFRHISNNVRNYPGWLKFFSNWARRVKSDLARACSQPSFWIVR